MGRSHGSHFWNGTLKRFVVSSPAIGKEPRIFNEPNHEEGKVSLNSIWIYPPTRKKFLRRRVSVCSLPELKTLLHLGWKP